MKNLILSKTPLVVAALVVGVVVGRCTVSEVVVDEQEGQAPTEAAEAAVPDVWTCSMHPQIRMPEPGDCPICGMDLILADAGGGDEEGISELRMSPGAMKRAKIQTAPVRRLELAHEVPLVGRVMLDETRVTTYTARVEGRLDRLFVDFTGTKIKAGEHIAEIYSPVLYSAQEELLRAIDAADKVEGSGLELLRESSLATVKSAHERLHLFGIDEEQIDELIERGKPSVYMTLRSPVTGTIVHKAVNEGAFVKEGQDIVKIADLSKVWVVLDAYESDLVWLRYGQSVRFTVEAYPGEVFEARVAFIDPILDPNTRTVKVRLNVENQELRLKPDMFVRARVDAFLSSAGEVMDESLAGVWMCPMHPEVTAHGPGECSECGMPLVPSEELGFRTQEDAKLPLAIPDTAPMFTGKRSVVYVELPNREMPSFEGREVLLGPHAGDYYVVVDGLMEGERVVVQGNFKIDSELQIRAKHSMMSSEMGGAASQPASGPPLVVAGDFRRGLAVLLESYLNLADALASDTLDAGAQAGLESSFEALDMGLLDARAHRAWMERSSGLAEGVEKVASAPDLEAARESFGPLSASLLAALEEFGFEDTGTPLAIFHCPMAYDNKGADWIAPDGPTRNPYFGSGMLKCGDITDSLNPSVPEMEGVKVDDEGVMDKESGAVSPMGMGTAAEANAWEVSPAFQQQLAGLVRVYLEFESGLAQDSESAESRARLSEAFEAIEMGELRGEAHEAWMKGAPELGAAIEAVIAARNLEEARATLAPLSAQLVSAIERFGLPDSETRELAVFHCPMAFDFEGADWLGPAGPVENPYFGSDMFSCGKEVRRLKTRGER